MTSRIFQDEINEAAATSTSTYQRHLDALRKTAAARNQKGPYDSAKLGEYGIDGYMWKQWAAAAGYPNAKYLDPTVYERVAKYAAKTLWDEFGNDTLVAIGWRFGPGIARQMRDSFGANPDMTEIEKYLGDDGSQFVSAFLQELTPINIYGGGGGGSVELSFSMEQDQKPSQNPKPAAAGSVLTGVLGAMADRIAGGTRGQISAATPQVVSGDTEPALKTAVPEE
jgi:hypothetical protein